MIRDMSNAEAGVLEETCRANKTRRCEISLGCRQANAKEATHECAGNYAKSACELTYGANHRRREKERLKEASTIYG